ncbi:nonstructural protein [Apis mellifera associated microvirus 32]|nr:nonstructural protein [Apis mellifera associated microvirus 32]
MKLFAIMDIKSQFFLNPFAESGSVAALRGFETAVNEAKSSLHRFPDDFALFELAEFDVRTGVIKVHPSPVNLASARSVLHSQSQSMLPGLKDASRSGDEVRQ